MGINTNVSDLDASQIIQREYDVANDAQRVNLVAGTVNATSAAVGTNGTTAPTSSSQGGGVDGSGNLRAVSVDSSGNQNVNVLSSVLPTGAATSANQTSEITQLTAINTATSALNTRLAGALVPAAFDYISQTYVTSGNGTGQTATVIYKTGGASGTTVATLTMAYDGSNRLSSVTKT